MHACLFPSVACFLIFLCTWLLSGVDFFKTQLHLPSPLRQPQLLQPCQKSLKTQLYKRGWDSLKRGWQHEATCFWHAGLVYRTLPLRKVVGCAAPETDVGWWLCARWAPSRLQGCCVLRGGFSSCLREGAKAPMV